MNADAFLRWYVIVAAALVIAIKQSERRHLLAPVVLFCAVAFGGRYLLRQNGADANAVRTFVIVVYTLPGLIVFAAAMKLAAAAFDVAWGKGRSIYHRSGLGRWSRQRAVARSSKIRQTCIHKWRTTRQTAPVTFYVVCTRCGAEDYNEARRLLNSEQARCLHQWEAVDYHSATGNEFRYGRRCRKCEKFEGHSGP